MLATIKIKSAFKSTNVYGQIFKSIIKTKNSESSISLVVPGLEIALSQFDKEKIKDYITPRVEQYLQDIKPVLLNAIIEDITKEK